MPYPPTVETPQLTLRRFVRADEDALLEIWSDPEVWSALRPGQPFDREHGRARFRHHVQHWDEHGFGIWLIRDRDSGETAGWVGASHPDFVRELSDEIEIGWSLRRSFRGRGIATEGAMAAVAAAREHLRPARVISLIDPANLRSAAVARRLGMRDVGSVVHAEFGVEVRVYALELGDNEVRPASRSG
jgi:RimJ/RimL family protein N-acetyltransferase